MNTDAAQSTNGKPDVQSTPPPSALTPPVARLVPKSLVLKLTQVMGLVERVAKNGLNTNQNYKYATEADILAEVRAALAQRSVLVVPDVETVTWRELDSRSGGKLQLCTARVRFDLMDAESGEVLSVPMVGQGSDSGDKAFYKAMSGATKYLFMKLFLIPTGDDPENEKPQKPQPPPPAGMAAVKATMRATPTPPRLVPQQQAAPARQAAHDRSTPYPFGTTKGHPISDVDDKSLAYWATRIHTELNDPSKAKWHPRATQQLAVVQAEQRFRAGGNGEATGIADTRSDEPPPHSDADAPF